MTTKQAMIEAWIEGATDWAEKACGVPEPRIKMRLGKKASREQAEWSWDKALELLANGVYGVDKPCYMR